MKCMCVVSCFYKKRLWNVGDELEVPEGEGIPSHFEPFKVQEVEDLYLPATLSEMQKKYEGERYEGTDPRTLGEATDMIFN